MMKDLIHRRVPQILGLYLGGSWALIQYVDWIVNRYLLSPYLTDIAQVILISLIPAVVLLAYFHGAPDRQGWSTVEKIGIPLNVILSGALIFFLFSGKELGATSKTVVVQDETGQQIQRTIPKQAFRKRLALFPFENRGNDAALNWLGYGLDISQTVDLSQDLFLEMWDYRDLASRLEKAGFPDGLKVPLALKRKIAREVHLGHFLTGSFRKNGDQLTIEAAIYETNRGKKIAAQRFSGDNVFSLVDDISLFIKKSLKIPRQALKDVQDLPVSEISTHSMTALQAYIRGLNAIVFKNDYPAAQRHFEAALNSDPTFGQALYLLASVYLNTNAENKAKKTLEKAMQYLYKLPERTQFYVKSSYYFINQEIDKQFALYKMWAELYPLDTSPHLKLGQAYFQRNDFDKAIGEWKIAAEIDPNKYYIFHNIGTACFRKGAFDEALNYYRRYAETYPGEKRSFLKLGDLYESLGKLTDARENYEKALLLDPYDISAQTSLARLELLANHFENALASYQKALENSRTPQDSSTAYSGLRYYYFYRGQVNRAFDYWSRVNAMRRKFRNPLSHLIDDRLLNVQPYADAQKYEEAFQNFAEVEKQLPSSLKAAVDFGRLQIYLAMKDMPKAEAALEKVSKAIDIYHREDIRHYERLARGRIYELKGDYAKALEYYLKRIETEPWRSINETANLLLGRCYRKAGNFGKSREYLQKILDINPNSPQGNAEMAYLENDLGNPEKAKVYLKKALRVWENADPVYRDAQNARQLYAKLQLS